jgi:Golgi nucleoside diphosphatase
VISVKPAAIKTPIWSKSVKRTKEIFENKNELSTKKYEKELLYLEKNALDNNNNAIPSYVVVDTIVKIINTKNPKSSYNIGFQATFMEFLSKLPISLVNRLIKSKLNKIK